MKTIKTTLTTEAVFSKDGKKRYLLRKSWDSTKPTLAIIMLAPSEADGIQLDTTTLLVLNNACRLGFGSVAILNLFATLGDFKLKQAETEDSENINTITDIATKADTIVYAPGVGKSKNKVFSERQEKVISSLIPFESKLNCLCNKSGNARLQHPLSPSVRTWYLSPLKTSELISVPEQHTATKGKKSTCP